MPHPPGDWSPKLRFVFVVSAKRQPLGSPAANPDNAPSLDFLLGGAERVRYKPKPNPPPTPRMPSASSFLILNSSFAATLPTTFVTDLRADRDAFNTAGETVEGKRQSDVEATKAIELGLRAAGKEIRYLNAIMHNKYNRTPEKLRAWESASRLERAPEKKKEGNTTVPQT